MALDKLQIRRDSLANFRSATVNPNLAEIIMLTDEWRTRRGVSSPFGQPTPFLGVPETPYPMADGIPISMPWSVSYYGNRSSSGAYVPPDIANQALKYIASGSIGDHTLLDACHCRVTAVGDYEVGSPQPRMLFAFALGSDTGTPVILKPKTHVIGAFNWGQYGIEVSIDTVGENALGGYVGKFQWHLEANLMFLGHNGDGQFSTEGGPSTVRVFGRLTWGQEQTSEWGFHSSPGQFLSGTTRSWQPNRGTNVPKDQVLVHHGRGYRALYNVPSLAVSGYAVQDYLNALSDTQPGAGRYWRQHWVPTKQWIDFEFESEVDLTATGKTLSLLASGPYQSDMATTFPAWDINPDAADGGAHGALYWGDMDVPGGVFHGCVSFGGVDYTARHTHGNPSVQPGGAAGDPWERYWRALNSTRSDSMTVYATTAVLFGGRPGIGDTHLV